MRQVKGFLSDDGVFFDAHADAELYEAMHDLELVVKNIGANPEKFLVVLDGCHKQVRRYLDAKEGFKASEASGVASAAAGTASHPEHNADDAGAETHAPVLEQPFNESKSVPDVGSGERTEAVPDYSEVDGIGGRSTHARGLRSTAHLATTSQAALSTSRGGSGGQAVRPPEAGSKLPRSGV